MNVKRKKIFLIISEINLALIRKAALQNSVNFVEIIYRTIICRKSVYSKLAKLFLLSR